MEYGYICFAYSKNEFIAWAIAKVTKSQWSHSFITVPPMLGKEMVMEAAGQGVSMCEFDLNYRNNPNQKYEVYKLNIDASTTDPSILTCMAALETSYGYLEYPWFIWRYINKLFGRDIKGQNNWCQNGTFVCSQLCRKYAEGRGLTALCSALGNGSMSAQDLYEIVLGHPELFTLVEKKD